MKCIDCGQAISGPTTGLIKCTSCTPNGVHIGQLTTRLEKVEAAEESLFYKLTGVMHSVDKWWDEGEKDKHGVLISEMDEVQRSCYVREKCLQIIEGLQTELKRLTQSKGKK